MKRIRKTEDRLIIIKGGPQVCVHVKAHIVYMGVIGIWIKIKELKRNQKILFPLVIEEARQLAHTLLDFADKSEKALKLYKEKKGT